MNSSHIVLIAHNIRSIHNVGSIFRTADGFGVDHLYLTGYTPYPASERDTRLPHIIQKTTDEIAKTALGAEKTVAFSHMQNPDSVIDGFKAHGHAIVGLEQNPTAVSLPDYKANGQKIVLIIGEEVTGLGPELAKRCTEFVEIPMVGQKESFNVSVAVGIALYAFRYQL